MATDHHRGILALLVPGILAILLLEACGGESLPEAAAEGRAVAVANRCVTCHSTVSATDGTAGPTWVGRWGTERELADGTTVTYDRDYVAESVRTPDARTAKGGFAERMPAFPNLSDEDVDGIAAYIEYLGTNTDG